MPPSAPPPLPSAATSVLAAPLRRRAVDGRVLLIENSRSYAEMLAVELRRRLDLEVVTVTSLAAAREALASGPGFFLALTGLVLPDATPGRIASVLAGHGVPIVVVTGVYDEATRARLARLPIIDYVLKEAPGTIDYLIWLVRRVERNRRIGALVVDRSAGARDHVGGLLKLYGFKVAQVSDAAAGLALLEADKGVRLVVLDHDLEGIDGVEFVRRARLAHPRDMLSIVGASAAADALQVARLLKHGANDFVRKPFSREEFFCRIAQNIDNLELIGTLQDLATRDHLTGLANRRHFFESAGRMLAPHGPPVTVAMIDIDHFKHVNDTHGHDAGDVALRAVAETVAAHAGAGHLVARYGGEEFCLLANGLDEAGARELLESLRVAVAALRIEFKDRLLALTVSIGVCRRSGSDIHPLLAEADRLLYLAKAGGRDRVVYG